MDPNGDQLLTSVSRSFIVKQVSLSLCLPLLMLAFTGGYGSTYTQAIQADKSAEWFTKRAAR